LHARLQEENVVTDMPDNDATLLVSEMFVSIQGESTWAGCPCAFVRLTGCPLRCTYCDTTYAFTGGERVGIPDIVDWVQATGCRLVEVTGGEPLAQRRCIDLLRALVDRDYHVLLETSGALSIAEVPQDVHRIVDFKCPSSGEGHRICWENVELLTVRDEVKFVIGDRTDYEWARDTSTRHQLAVRCRAVLFSPVTGHLHPRTLAEWLLADRFFDVRLQLQLHKYIWPPDARGV